jgi:hypothetical protein
MKIRIVKPFAGYRAGQEFDWGDGAARIYIARGLAEQLEDREVEVAAVDDRVERASVQHAVRRKVK